ncbi:iron-sulfur cluster carrier protein ApbC [Shewanella salipaludis]|uniref:Iron-sulfur cluster carrier protein n=1 Tax=Shewanella salipaludis TaxID=2723052 RepID=A0A972FVV5_9GAMM|nr:iron-sulfur cluster carrier protein ApbC [Shewanella salipaludis]NMH64213.1 iron-sulfur cluster carrier protein ApbC [Shewanella salipaludis]
MSSATQDYRLSGDLLGPVLAILDAVIDPYLGRGLVSAGCVTQLAMTGKTLQLTLVYPYPCKSQYAATVAQLTPGLLGLEGVEAVECHPSFQAGNFRTATSGTALDKVKHVIAVASGKGGVGKSTTAVNLALALAAEGARVGILDADIYGPSIPLMLGIPDFKPMSPDGKHIAAAEVHGIAAQSLGFLISAEDATVWRGPMAAGALTQLLNETQWPELDYLVVDMPPGTGDIQLTLSQKVPLSGAVIVTTPQDIALADAKKGIVMFQKVNVPVLGIVENMSFHVCSECGHREHPFGADGGRKIAERYRVPLLGALPLQLQIREAMDKGAPCVVAQPESEVTQIYSDIARKVGAALAVSQPKANISISVTDEE